MRVAIIGTGIAGNAAAWALSKRYPVTVYDRELRAGGHSHTVTLDYDGTRLAVDIGFIVYNELNYPDLTALFAHLGVETVESCMSFAVTADAGRFEWKGGGNNWRETAGGLFAQPRNLLSPSYLWMLRDILTFNTQSIADYAAGVRAMTGVADYLTVNISSPNTPGLRALQDAGALDALLEAVIEARGAGPPVFLKLAPDLVPADIDAIARVAIDRRVDALIVANTTVSRPVLKSPQRDEAGGLSGAPLGPLALARLRDFAKATGGALPLIAAGGIASGADALARIRAGASLVQLYTAMVYEGPGLARRINRELKLLLAREGFARLEEAIGVERS